MIGWLFQTNQHRTLWYECVKKIIQSNDLIGWLSTELNNSVFCFSLDESVYKSLNLVKNSDKIHFSASLCLQESRNAISDLPLSLVLIFESGVDFFSPCSSVGRCR